MRAPVLIIGAHRSGTTATAQALEILGLQIGQRLDSHRESKALQQMHEEYLRSVGAAWHHPAPFIESIRTTEGEQRCVNYLRENMQRNFAHIFGYRKDLRGLWMVARLKFGALWGWKEPRTTQVLLGGRPGGPVPGVPGTAGEGRGEGGPAFRPSSPSRRDGRSG